MILHALRGDVPALHGVALRAIGTHLAAVNVRVAIGAIFSNVGEDRFGVALHALHFFVHAAQRIVRAVVIKFEIGSDGTPTA